MPAHQQRRWGTSSRAAPPRPPGAPGVDPRIDRYGAAALATVGCGGALVLGRALTGITLPCPLLALTGVPCPGCGTTSLATMVLRGQVGDAVTTDPAGVVLLVTLALLAALHVAGRWSAAADRVRAAVPTLALWGVVAGAIHWLTTIATGGALTT